MVAFASLPALEVDDVALDALDRGLRQPRFVHRVLATHAAFLAVAPPEEPDPDILRVALDVWDDDPVGP